jgi:glutaredoxin
MRKKAHRALSIALVCSAIPGAVESEIYRWVDESGETFFSDKPSITHPSEEVKLRINTYEGVTYDESSFDVGKKIVMYSTSWCGVCKKARRHFKKKAIDFTEYDVETSAKGKSEYKKLGAKGVPVILIGNQRMNGFSVDSFEKLYR